jgi:hypothetical protein
MFIAITSLPRAVFANKFLVYHVSFKGRTDIVELLVGKEKVILDRRLSGRSLNIDTPKYNNIEFKSPLKVEASSSEEETLKSLEATFGSQINKINVKQMDLNL